MVAAGGRWAAWGFFCVLSWRRRLQRGGREGEASLHFAVNPAAQSLKLDEYIYVKQKARLEGLPAMVLEALQRGGHMDEAVQVSDIARNCGEVENTFTIQGISTHFLTLFRPNEIGQSSRVIRLWFLKKALFSGFTSQSGRRYLEKSCFASWLPLLGINCLAHFHLHVCWQPHYWPYNQCPDLIDTQSCLLKALKSIQNWILKWGEMEHAAWNHGAVWYVCTCQWLPFPKALGHRHATAQEFGGLNPPALPRSPEGSTEVPPSADHTSS